MTAARGNGIAASSPKATTNAIVHHVDDLFSPNASVTSSDTLTATGLAPSPAFVTPKPVMKRRASRAAPPPPILVQTSSPPRPQLPSLPSSASSLQTLLVDNEAGEENDNVGELVTTPSRRGFTMNIERPTTPRSAEAVDERPVSPMSPWRSMDAPASESTYAPYVPPTRKPGQRPPSWHRNSLEVPSFKLPPPSPSSPMHDSSFEPTPYHGLHARNLSAYFPQPGAPRAPTSPSSEVAGESTIPDADRKIYGGPQDWQFGSQPPPGAAQSLESTPGPRGKRRGHHHKHSLSHNFFSFLDPTQTVPKPEDPASPVAVSPADATPQPVPMNITQSTTTLSPLPPSKHDPQVQLLISFAVVEAVLGAGLWVEGQISGWHCLAGVGYLVVFDAMGVGVNLLARSDNMGWRSLQKPFGSSRMTSLWCFTQSLFLMFAAVYIAKEALEQVVLGAGAHEHGVGTHSHGEVVPGEERPFPRLFLALASAATFFSGALLANHSRLVDATGPIFLPPWWTSRSFVQANKFLANPYTITVAGTCAVLLVAGLIVPSSSLQSLDSVVSLLLTLLTSALAWPPTAAFAQILLQTAPPAASAQMKDLRRALRDVADDRRVLGLGTFRCWAVNAGKPAPDSVRVPSAPNSRRGSVSTTSPSVSAFMQNGASSADLNALGLAFERLNGGGGGGAKPLSKANGSSNGSAAAPAFLAQVPLVVTLVVHVHPETTDRDVMDVTRLSWSKLTHAVNGRAGTAGGEGEVSVQVRRGWDGAD